MSLRKIIRGADEGTRRSFLSGMAQSMLGVGAAATFGPDLVANSLRLGSPLLNQDPKKTHTRRRAEARWRIFGYGSIRLRSRFLLRVGISFA